MQSHLYLRKSFTKKNLYKSSCPEIITRDRDFKKIKKGKKQIIRKKWTHPPTALNLDIPE